MSSYASEGGPKEVDVFVKGVFRSTDASAPVVRRSLRWSGFSEFPEQPPLVAVAVLASKPWAGRASPGKRSSDSDSPESSVSERQFSRVLLRGSTPESMAIRPSHAVDTTHLYNCFGFGR